MLAEPLLKAISESGYTTPTAIQQQAIPHILKGKDIIGCAQTGTGKTAAFALPILQVLDGRKNARNSTLILSPTRELALQIGESFSAYGKYTSVKHAVVFGGVSQVQQVNALRRGCDVIIATPGRLLDLLSQRILTLDNIQMFVLDEADRMLDMGFINDVKRIVAKLPKLRQTFFFSATMPYEIADLANSILHNPIQVSVTPVASTAEKIEQQVYHVAKEDKRSLLLHLLKDRDIDTAIVFTRTKHGADKVCKELNRANIRSEAIHGNRSQTARQKALQNIKTKQSRVLVATDIAARGIDIDHLSHVFNYDLPEVAETYVHRIGRTGRAGASGKAISFCDREERTYLRAITSLIAKQIEEVKDHPFYVEPFVPPASAAPQKGRNVFRNTGRTFRQR